MKEGFDTAQSLGRWFRDHKQYKEGFGPLFSDERVKELRSTSLDALRNKFVFHFDRDAIRDSLLTFPTTGDVRILSYPQAGPAVGETYFDAADDAAMGHLFGDSVSDEEYFARLGAWMNEVSDLLKRFMAATHRLIAIGLVDLGCYQRNMKRPPAPPPDAT
jgi:hypothetical protein